MKKFKDKDILSIRNKLKISQDKFARMLGVTAICVYKWEKGETLPNAENLIKLNKLDEKRRSRKNATNK